MDEKYQQQTKEGLLSNQVNGGFIQWADLSVKSKDQNFFKKTQIY